MTITPNKTVKLEQPSIKIEPDVSIDDAIASLKRTHNETEQRPVAKRRITAWLSDDTDSPEAQAGEFEQMSQSMSHVDISREDQADMSSPSSSTIETLNVGNLPFIPELIPNMQEKKTLCEDSVNDCSVALQNNITVPESSSPTTPNQSSVFASEPAEEKVRKITDFFSIGHFDPNRFFTPPKPPPPAIKVEVKIEPIDGPSTSKTLPKKVSKLPSPKKKVPPSKQKVATSKRLIKPDPEEMSDDMMSEGEVETNDKRAQNKRKNKNGTIYIDVVEEEEKRFVRSSPPAAPETSLSLSQIKELLEKIKDGQEPDLYDPKYYCKPCSKPFDRQKTFHNHIHSKHSVNIEERKFIVFNYGPKPNITDESQFCSHCQKQYDNKDRFQHHNELHHGAERIKTSIVNHKHRREKSVQEQDLEDDEMKAQEKIDTMEQNEKKNKYATKKDLENHRNLGYCQAAILEHTGPPPDVNDPNFHCNVCNATYSNRGSYHFHLRRVHKMDFSFATSNEKVRKAYRGPLPDIHHPKNYCCICDIFYSQKLVYTYHLRNVHNMDIPFDKSPGVRIAIDDITDESRKPDKSDPDYYCAYCNRGYTQRSSYLIHLNKMHFIDIPQRRPGAMRPRPPLEPGVSPDVLDPNHYCCVCDVKFAHANSYRIHIKKYHGLGDALEAITLKSRSKRSNYYLDRKITNAGYHEEQAKSTQQKLNFKPSDNET